VRKLLIALVAALLVIALLAAPVMAQGPEDVHVPDEATPGAGEANEHADEEAPELAPGELDVLDVPPDRL